LPDEQLFERAAFFSRTMEKAVRKVVKFSRRMPRVPSGDKNANTPV